MKEWKSFIAKLLIQISKEKLDMRTKQVLRQAMFSTNFSNIINTFTLLYWNRATFFPFYPVYWNINDLFLISSVPIYLFINSSITNLDNFFFSFEGGRKGSFIFFLSLIFQALLQKSRYNNYIISSNSFRTFSYKQDLGWIFLKCPVLISIQNRGF